MSVGERHEVAFSIDEAGCLIYVADAADLIGTQGTGPITGGELYQDDGYNVRLVLGGELTDEEQSNWTSRAEAKFSLPSGDMIVSGILDPDFDRWVAGFGAFAVDAGDGGRHELGCRVAVPAGDYRVAFYGYPPNDLAGGWMRIEEPGDFKAAFSEDPGPDTDEKAVDYFTRTRPGEPVPEWVSQGWEDAAFLDFVIHLRTLDGESSDLQTDPSSFLDWQFRKPDVCPLGIRL
jgi:hypothetical protein